METVDFGPKRHVVTDLSDSRWVVHCALGMTVVALLPDGAWQAVGIVTVCAVGAGFLLALGSGEP
jgi:hypothetical protein